MRYPIAAPDLSGNEAAYVARCLESTWISSNGEFVERFERQVAEFCGVRHAVGTCNGTAALHLALEALGVGPGDEVIVPSLTFIATANAAAYTGADVVFADCTPDAWRLDPESVERMLSPRTKAIVAVHLYGHPCQMDELSQIASDRGLWLVEDAAEAFGAEYRGRRTGSLGHVGMFSFFGNKTITTGEGGMVTTDDDELAVRLRLLRGQGMDPERRYVHIVRGYNYRLTNVAAAIGVGQMERAEQLVEDRRRIARWYDRRLADVGSLTLPVETPEVRNSYWMYSLLLESADDRDGVMEHLKSCGVETRPFFYPVHEMPMYRSARTDRVCPVTRDVSYRGISLPSSSYLREEDIDEIASALRAAVEANSPIVKAA